MMTMMTGERIIEINGERHVMRFDWRALSEIESKYGDNPNLFNPQTVAEVAAAGLRNRHPAMTADRIMELSPPLIPFAQAVQQAIQWAYFGTETPPDSDGVKKNRLGGGFLRLIGSRLKAAYRLLIFGI